jgi:hypothetical protein
MSSTINRNTAGICVSRDSFPVQWEVWGQFEPQDGKDRNHILEMSARGEVGFGGKVWRRWEEARRPTDEVNSLIVRGLRIARKS